MLNLENIEEFQTYMPILAEQANENFPIKPTVPPK